MTSSVLINNQERSLIYGKLGKNLDPSFRSKYKIDSEKITIKGDEIYRYEGCFITKFEWCEKNVVAKSYKNDCACNKVWPFVIELLAFKLIKDQENKESNEFFAQFLGYILHDQYDNHPHFGSIVLKWYNMGNLYEYCKDLNKRKQKSSFSSSLISHLIDLARQIALCKYFEVFLWKSLKRTTFPT